MRTTLLKKLLTINLLIILSVNLSAQNTAAGGLITNDCFWNTVEGKPIYSQGGGIFKFKDADTGQEAYYWYGAHYKEAELYREDPSLTQPRNNLVGVSCYRSTDLVHWQDMGHIITAKEIAQDRPWVGWFGRMGVAYVDECEQYALFAQHNNSVFIALSDSPTGPYKVHKRIDMKPIIGTSNTGDQTVFTDEDSGKDYLIYSYGRGRHIAYVSEIGLLEDGSIGLKNCVQVYKGSGREGNCMFKYKGRYYLCASNLYGWDSSFAYYLVSDDIYGPYQPLNNMRIMAGCEKDYAHVTQTGFFYTLRGSKEETVIYCGDRWADFAGNGLGYNQWFPLSFTEDSLGVAQPYFNSLSQWILNSETGEWKVGKDNNYILNGSFEADRRRIPNPVKPRQEYLLGWDTEVIEGNTVSLDNPHSPKLNYENTQADRQVVIGEKSLCISDSVDFERTVSQKLESTESVALPDGRYLLSFYFRENGLFETLDVVVNSGKTSLREGRAGAKGKKLHLAKAKTGDQWQKASMKVRIKGGRAQVQFHAKGKALAHCLIDDISLVRID